jgi:hypothetical protein
MHPMGRTEPKLTKKRVAPTQVDPVEWLLEESQPSIRYRALTELLGRNASDPEVRAAKKLILEKGWAAEILSRRRPGGGWAVAVTARQTPPGTSTEVPNQYRPKYVSTNWMMLVLSDLGLTRSEPVIAELCEFWMKGFAAKDGGLGGSSTGTPHYCVAANMARALIRFGYSDDPRVLRTLEWLVKTAHPKGGWSCWGSGRNLDSWEAMSAFAAYPREKWTENMQTCVEKGAEFFLQRHLHQQGARYAPWYRFHYPVHYYYDLLVGLDFMTALGYAGDPRMGYAVQFLRSRRRRDGTWSLDAVHPDVEGPIATWFAQHPRQRPTPFALEKAGQPSKMITLTALRVLDAVDRVRSATPRIS